MNRTLHTFVACAAVLGAAGAAAHATAATAAAPSRIALPLNGKAFHTGDMAISANGAQVCITGSDIDGMGKATERLVLVDREHQGTLWNKPLARPDGIASLDPVQCLVDADRVYVLANGSTRMTPDLAKTRAYVYAFDLRGNQVATTRLGVSGDNQYGHTMAATPDGVTVTGYAMDADNKDERYATFTLALDARLQTHGTPLLRRNGAYATPYAARLAGDSLYIIGNFFQASVPKNSLGKPMVSRLKTGGGYVWSSALPEGSDIDRRFAVAPDGTSYALGVAAETTTLTVTAPDGQVRTPLTQHGGYCSIEALTPYGSGVAAVVEPCKAKANQLVTIALPSGKPTTVTTIPDNPLYVTANGTLWSVLARDAAGKSYLYTGDVGGL